MDATASIVFDAVGTLIRPQESVSAVYHRCGQRHGSKLERAEVRERFGKGRHLFFTNSPEQPSSDAIERQLWSQLVQFVFADVATWQPLFEELWDYYASPGSWNLYPEVTDCLERLWEGGYTVAIASNFDSRLVAICRALSPLDRVRHLYFSGQLGYRKPDPHFYELIRRQLPAGDQTPLMIGDDAEKDVAAALRAGWQARHLDRSRLDLGSLTSDL
jgi:putative hydrolase of the HAD superfamily